MRSIIECLPVSYKKRGKEELKSISLDNLSEIYEWASWAEGNENLDEYESLVAENYLAVCKLVSGACMFNEESHYILESLIPEKNRNAQRLAEKLSRETHDYCYISRDLWGRLALNLFCKNWRQRKECYEKEEKLKIAEKEENRKLQAVADKTKYSILDCRKIEVKYSASGDTEKIFGVISVSNISSVSGLMVFDADMLECGYVNSKIIEMIRCGSSDVSVKIICADTHKTIASVRGRLGTTPDPDYGSSKFKFGVYGPIRINDRTHGCLSIQADGEANK